MQIIRMKKKKKEQTFSYRDENNVLRKIVDFLFIIIQCQMEMNCEYSLFFHRKKNTFIHIYEITNKVSFILLTVSLTHTYTAT
jgi:hypothetical protein